MGKDQPTKVLKCARAIKPLVDNGFEQIVFYDCGIGSYYDSIAGGRRTEPSGAAALMSPETKPWEQCFLQKVFAEDPVPLCIRFIYQKNLNRQRDAAIDAAENVESIFNFPGNLMRCCPKIDVLTHTCALGGAWDTSRTGACLGAR